MQSAAKVGLLLVVFVGLLIGGYAVLGKSFFGTPSDPYYVDLIDAGGVTEGTQVLMAGVAVGTVAEVRLVGPSKARMKLQLKKGLLIPSGTTLQLPTSLIGFGDNPVTLLPSANPGPPLSPGATLVRIKGSPLDSILPEGKQTVKELNKTMVAFRKLLEDQKLQSKVADLLTTTNKTLDRFGSLASNINSLLASNQNSIGRAILAATAAVEDVHKVTSRVADLVKQGKLQKEAMTIMDRMTVITKHAGEMIVSLNSLINDPKLRGPAAVSASNIAEITNTGKSIATNVAEITKNGTAISENAAVITKKAITLTDRATEVATKATEIEDQLKGVLDKVGGFFNKAPSTGSLPKIVTEMDLMRQSQPGYWRTDVNFTIPLSDSTLNLGIFDALESDKINVQLGKNVTTRFGYRYGVYASKPAIGVDYLLAPRLSLRGDAWDVNNPRLDLRTSYEIGNGLIGWVGLDRVLHDNALTFGIGVRR